MQFTIQVTVPTNAQQNYSGIKQITYTFSSEVLGTTRTVYTTSEGDPVTVGSATLTEPSGDYTEPTARYGVACGKDAGTLTVNIDAQLWIKNGPGNPTTWDDLTDTLTVKVEPPTIDSFTVADSSSQNTNASPLAFLQTDSQGNPHAQGGNLGFEMAVNGTEKYVAFYATLTNNTHYDLAMGFIPTVNRSRHGDRGGGGMGFPPDPADQDGDVPRRDGLRSMGSHPRPADANGRPQANVPVAQVPDLSMIKPPDKVRRFLL